VATLAEILNTCTESLNTHSDTPRLDAELLICHVLNIPKTKLFTDAEQRLESDKLTAINELVQQRITGQPVAYLVGYRDFWTLRLKVTPATLIPRPETELLVETALTLFSADEEINLIDLGTGTGAIALSIASERPGWHITATDASSDALAVAIENAETIQLHNVTLLQSHWFDDIADTATYDMIISNPPYVAEDAEHLRQRGVRYEPQAALRAGSDGLNDIRIIIPASKKHLKKNGWLLLEHGFDQGETVLALFKQHGFRNIQQKKDLAGHTRISYAQL
jgi:release factor glutamine methyltransferase